jgi:histone H3/H4
MLIVKAKIKEIAGDYNVAGDVAEALNQKAEQLVKDACERAKSNNRKTVMAKDL